MISWDGDCMRNLIFESGVPSYLGSSEHQHSAATGQRNHFQLIRRLTLCAEERGSTHKEMFGKFLKV